MKPKYELEEYPAQQDTDVTNDAIHARVKAGWTPTTLTYNSHDHVYAILYYSHPVTSKE